MLYTTHLRRILFSLIILGFGLALFAQTGPGGVGSSASNILWLKANEITGVSNGADLLTWTDASGNANTLTAPSSTFSPTYQTSVINGLPVVRFSKANGRIRRTSFTDFPTTDITVIYVNKTTDSGDGTISYASSTSNNNDFLLFRSENLNVYRGTNIGSGVSFNDNSFHIANAVWRNSDGRVEVWKDGSQDFTSTGFRTGTSITAGGSLAIAGEQDQVDGGYASGQAHFGDFSEVMIFDTFLNTAQNIIVSNYLAAKYALTISNDRYAYQSTHASDVAGIGREDVSNTHTAAMSADILRVEGATGLDANQEYLLFGHNGSDATTAWTTTEAPDAGTDIQRLAREWRFDETGNVGDVDVVIDVAGMPSLPVGHTMYALMVDSDGDFSSGASVYELTFSAGTEYTYAGYDINDGDYMAIAAVRPTIQHTLTSGAGAEDTNASIEVELNFITASSRTVEVTTADVSTTVVDDYTALSGSTVTITAGNSSVNYTITIIDDSDAENNESLTATLANPSAGLNLGANSVFTYTIEDNDQVRKVYFDASSSNGSETTTSVNVGLSISLEDLVNPTSVDYSVTGGTATGSGTDYTLASGTVTFAAGVTTGSFNITINNESLFELDETIIVSLSNPVNCNLDNTMPFEGTGFITHTYTINNDDTAPMIQFNTTSSSASETITSVAFQVDLNGVSGAEASASYTLSGTATGGGVDYILSNGIVSIPAGSTTVDIDAVIINDSDEEVSETMILTLSAPSNSTLGTNTIYTYTIVNNSIIGFTGPGGVGQASSNILWTRPEELAIVADGTDITTWSDFSGNANDLTQSDASFKPRYYGSIINSQPVVRFDQTNGRLIRNSFSGFPTEQVSVFFVNATNETSDDALLSYASSASSNEFLLFSTNSLNVFRANSSTNSSTSFNGGSFNIGTTTWQGSNGGTSVWKNGSRDYNITGFQTGTSMTAGGTLAIGAEQDAINGGYDAAQDHLGDIAEIAIYNLALNQAQIVIVQNYLSAKYNVALSTNNVYDQDDPGNGNYDFEVAGIGRIGSSDLHTDAKGSGIVRVNNPTSLDDEDFLMWGHDNTDLRATSTDVPMGVSRRFERVWRVSEVNRSSVAIDVGAVDISFDLTGLGDVTASDLVLLVDTDGTFATGATEITGAISDGGGFYRFANVTALTDNVRFTLASIDVDQTPLPVELISFRGEVTEGGQVALNWQTASEVNNSHFTIERSQDAITFETIDRIGGNGDSEGIISYAYIDRDPFQGRSFYRLKQHDFTGQTTNSEIVSVFVDQPYEGPEYKIYPNPASHGRSITIEYQLERSQQIHLTVTSVNGGQILDQRINLDKRLGAFRLETAGMKKGLNLIRLITSDGEVSVLKLIIN